MCWWWLQHGRPLCYSHSSPSVCSYKRKDLTALGINYQVCVFQGSKWVVITACLFCSRTRQFKIHLLYKWSRAGLERLKLADMRAALVQICIWRKNSLLLQLLRLPWMLGNFKALNQYLWSSKNHLKVLCWLIKCWLSYTVYLLTVCQNWMAISSEYSESTTKTLPWYSLKCKHSVLKITLILQQSLSLGTLQKTAAPVVCK